MPQILYNVTVNIDTDHEKAWVEWMESEHIPEVMATGFFLTARLCRLLVEEDPRLFSGVPTSELSSPGLAGKRTFAAGARTMDTRATTARQQRTRASCKAHPSNTRPMPPMPASTSAAPALPVLPARHCRARCR